MLIDKTKTAGKNPPLCPYCWETIERPSFMPEKGCEPVYRYMYCLECKALLAIVPIVPEEEMNVKELDEIIHR